jgi:hypothetical protein
MISTPDNYTCSILCQKLRNGEITVDEWYKYNSMPTVDVFDLHKKECSKFVGCDWGSSFGATGVIPPGHCLMKDSGGYYSYLAHDGLPIPSRKHGNWKVISGEWVNVGA